MTDKQSKYSTAEPADEAKADEKPTTIEDVKLQVLWKAKQKEQFAERTPISPGDAPAQKYRKLKKYER